MLKDALDSIPESTREKEARLAAMAEPSPPYQRQIRWIGRMRSRRSDP